VGYEVRRESEGELLPGAKPEIELRAWIRPEYVAERAEERLRGVLERMGFEFELRPSIEGRIVQMDVRPRSDSSLLIGRDGQNLEALEYLVNRMAIRCGREAPMVVVDVAEYRRKQFRGLERLVERAVKRARESGNEIELDAMPAATRKYLHNYLRRFEGITTFSRGEEPERYLVIISD
jgi:spoIIIJ-associated protein